MIDKSINDQLLKVFSEAGLMIENFAEETDEVFTLRPMEITKRTK